MNCNPLLANVRIGQFETLVSLQYRGASEDGGVSTYRSIREVARDARRLGQFDVAFLDPFRTYQSSLEAFRAFGRCTRTREWLIVHDCYPPYTSPPRPFRQAPGAARPMPPSGTRPCRVGGRGS